MHKKFRLWIVVAAFLACVGVSLIAQAAVEVGVPAPPLVLQRLDGKAFDLVSLKGKIVIIHFWATWCPSCREEMLALEAFDHAHKGQGVEMIAISTDRPRQRDKVIEEMRAYGFSGAILSDVSVNGFGASSFIPVTYVIDKDGIVCAILTPDDGVMTEKTLMATIQPLLSH